MLRFVIVLVFIAPSLVMSAQDLAYHDDEALFRFLYFVEALSEKLDESKDTDLKEDLEKECIMLHSQVQDLKARSEELLNYVRGTLSPSDFVHSRYEISDFLESLLELNSEINSQLRIMEGRFALPAHSIELKLSSSLKGSLGHRSGLIEDWQEFLEEPLVENQYYPFIETVELIYLEASVVQKELEVLTNRLTKD